MSIDTTKMGRPPKISYDEKKKIVDSYFKLRAGSDPAKLREHSICQQIASYADAVDWRDIHGNPLKPRDFADPQTKSYIDSIASLAEDIKGVDSVCLPVYMPLDMIALQCKPKMDIVQIIRQREDYYQKVCIDAAQAHKYAMTIQEDINREQNKYNELVAVYEEVLKENDFLRDNYDKVLAYNKKLVHLCRELGDKNAKEYFAELPMKGLGKEKYVDITQRPAGSVLEPIAAPDLDPFDDILEWKFGE